MSLKKCRKCNGTGRVSTTPHLNRFSPFYESKTCKCSIPITDTERLDWFIKSPDSNHFYYSDGGYKVGINGVVYKTPREAIDAAMKGSK